MTMKPTRYDFEQPIRMAGTTPEFNVSINITAANSTSWTATLNVTSVAFQSSGIAQGKLRDELLRLAALLGGG